MHDYRTVLIPLNPLDEKNWYVATEFCIGALCIGYLGYEQFCRLLSLWDLLRELRTRGLVSEAFCEALPLILFARSTALLPEDIARLDSLLVGAQSLIDRLGPFTPDRILEVERRFMKR